MMGSGLPKISLHFLTINLVVVNAGLILQKFKNTKSKFFSGLPTVSFLNLLAFFLSSLKNHSAKSLEKRYNNISYANLIF